MKLRTKLDKERENIARIDALALKTPGADELEVYFFSTGYEPGITFYGDAKQQVAAVFGPDGWKRKQENHSSDINYEKQVDGITLTISKAEKVKTFDQRVHPSEFNGEEAKVHITPARE